MEDYVVDLSLTSHRFLIHSEVAKLSNKLIDRLIEGTQKQSNGKSVIQISNIRDEYLVELQKLRKKYEKKLR